MNVGLVLSGGGARGIAHIGVLKALKEKDITITHVAGTSAGAIVGSLFSAGHSWDVILDFFKNTSLFNYKKYAGFKPGFIDTEKFYNDLKPYFIKDDFSTLKNKLVVTATDLMTGELKFFRKGELIKPILASAAVPGVFTPVKVGENVYIDGGILNNFPVKPLLKKCNKIIGVHVNPLESTTFSELKHSYQVVNRAFQISLENQSFSKFSKCDIIIAPESLNKYGIFGLKNVEAIFNIGYEAALKALDKRDKKLSEIK